MAAANNVEQGKAFVKVLAAVLTRLVANNDQVSLRLWRLEGRALGGAILRASAPACKRAACPGRRAAQDCGPPRRPMRALLPMRRSPEPQQPQR